MAGNFFERILGSQKDQQPSKAFTSTGVPIISHETLANLQTRYLNARGSENWGTHINNVENFIYSQADEQQLNRYPLASYIEYCIRDVLQYSELSTEAYSLLMLGVAYGVIAVIGQQLDPAFGSQEQTTTWPKVSLAEAEDLLNRYPTPNEWRNHLHEVEERTQRENPWLYAFIDSQGPAEHSDVRKAMIEVAAATIAIFEVDQQH